MASQSLNQRADPRVLRAYFECRHGQLHVTHAVPAGGGFDEATAVVCVPDSSSTGGAFAPLLRGLGRDRSVYAIDLPGTGMSDGAPGVESALGALFDLLDNLRLRRVNLVAIGNGLAIASRLRTERPQAIGGIVLLTPAGAPADQAANRVGARQVQARLQADHALDAAAADLLLPALLTALGDD